MITTIIPAAGSGIRLGQDTPKALVKLGDYPIFLYSFRSFINHPHVNKIILAVPSGTKDIFLEHIHPYVKAHPDKKVLIVHGGRERGDSIAAALRTDLHPRLSDSYYLIHDGARPFIPTPVIDRILLALKCGNQGVIPILPVADTIKLLHFDGTVDKTLPRRQLASVQTPQGFQAAALHRAYQELQPHMYTDDASMLEALGIAVETVDGSELTRKITFPQDLKWAKHYISTHSIPMTP